MCMPDPIPTFEALVRHIDAKHPKLGYIHVIEPDSYGTNAVAPGIVRSNNFVDAIRLPRPVIHASDFNHESAVKAAERDGVIVAFGRPFIANPDLPVRLERNRDLNEADVKTFYTHGAEGYLDYPVIFEGHSENSVL
jgi:NADPH2 dehydrogenase